MKATEQYLPVVLFIMLNKMVPTFESVDEILKCDHSNESYWAVLSCGTVYYAVQSGSNFWVCGRNPMMWPFKWKLLGSTFLWYCFLSCTKMISFESVNVILNATIQIKLLSSTFRRYWLRKRLGFSSLKGCFCRLFITPWRGFIHYWNYWNTLVLLTFWNTELNARRFLYLRSVFLNRFCNL